MKVTLPYLNTTFPLEFPDENLLAIAEPNAFNASGSTEEILAEALAHTAGEGKGKGQSLDAFLSGCEKLLILVNDATRPTPTETILKSLLPAIKAAGIDWKHCTILVATGAHRKPSEEEYRQILGIYYDSLRNSCIAHDARNDDEMLDFGSTRNGTPILLNKRLFEAGRIIVTGSVEPHYFAGFTGGRKAFLPGIAAYRTIQENHKQALSPAARSLALEGNPVHEDMMDALPLIKAPVFAIMTVLDKDQGVAAATAGDLMGSFLRAVDVAKKIFSVSVPAKADIVVSVAKFPMDIDLYQSQKAIDNGAAALKDGGTLILVSSCRDGIGDEAYANLLSSASSPADVMAKIREGYKLGYHKAAKMAAISERAVISAVSELSEERLKSVFIHKEQTPQAALDEAFRRARAGGVAVPRITILPDGCVTVPVPS
ncbi:MAG: nickel-dependent lactate racemase [Treponema sp.]|jgi:nickel-dependent lactate racemase|nr:nickel-dependent lactate racemase [Treponema sp.]